VELVGRNFWWPGVTREVKQYVEEYDACQRNKNCTEQPAGKLMPNSIPDKALMGIKFQIVFFIRNKGDRCKSENCSL